MATTRTRQVTFERLNSRRDTAPSIVRLMMACNDMSLANEALTRWKESSSRSDSHRRSGAMMYFARLQFAHLHEALQIVPEIRATLELHSLLARCDARTKESFAVLEEYCEGGQRHAQFNKHVEVLRSNLVFHYDERGKLIRRAIEQRAAGTGSNISSITRGDSAYRWRFNVADDLVDSIVVRQIWKIAGDGDLRGEGDAIVMEVHAVFLAFMDFAGEFIWKYFE